LYFYFEPADKGTLFLDELAELSLPMQVKLLRAVQEKNFRPVGDTREKHADVRIIAATNKDLETELMAGRFREDLYYRLNVINIHMPPLRDRQGDIPLLAQYFLEKYSRDMGKDVRKVSAYALDILSNYIFPGNVRELENIIGTRPDTHIHRRKRLFRLQPLTDEGLFRGVHRSGKTRTTGARNRTILCIYHPLYLPPTRLPSLRTHR
jgi:transcriptional regulator with PAS, ATPase and Fis domain